MLSLNSSIDMVCGVMNKKIDTFRIEKDYLGEIKIPAEVYYGVQTSQAIENFPISQAFSPRFI